MKILAVLFICLMVAIAGCQTYTKGTPITKEKVTQIQLGKTNAAQVVSILGKPDKVEPGQAGTEKYIYNYYQDKPSKWYKIDEITQQKLEVTLAGGVAQRISMVEQDKNPK